ncbi:hypothetical protein [Rhizobium sp.]
MTPPTLLSLGHSCQTRFILDALDGASRRMPFDFNITTRPALIAALDSGGRSLHHDEDSAKIFAMPLDGREGIEVGGLFYWHDYPLGPDKLRLADGWQREIDRVNEKYAALWTRLAQLLRADAPKTVLLSNSQHNLAQFAATEADFAEDFGLGRKAFEEIAGALDRFGAKNYRLLFLTREIADLAETIALDDPRLDHRFVGILSLRPDRRVAASLKADESATGIAPLAGAYDNGLRQIRALSHDCAIIHQRTDEGLRPFGSIGLVDGAPVAWFQGRDQFKDISHLEGEIRFPDGSIWRRD